MNIYALIVAAGHGSRLESYIPKQYLSLSGRTILEYSLQTFIDHQEIKSVQLVVSPKHRHLYDPLLEGYECLSPIEGGQTRSESVKAGLKALKKQGADYVLIHDAARPFVSSSMIDSVIRSLKTEQAVIPALMCTDTIKQGDEYVEKTLDRSQLKRIQTPQGFHLDTLLTAYERCGSVTDEAQVMEQNDIPVKMIEGDENLFKITTTDDYKRAKNMSQKIRVGQGFDVHQLIAGDGVVLGGILIPCDFKLKGHSDADVALHALVDAILGAIGRGDIGQHFSPQDARWKDADSSLFVKEAVKWMEEGGYALQNVDLTIICEAPKIGPHRDKMQDKIATLLKIDKSDVNIKATTTEQLGFTGRGEGIAAQAIVCVCG